MHKRFQQFQDYHKKSRRIMILFLLDFLFLIMALFTVLPQSKQLHTITVILIIIDILLIILTAIASGKNLIIVNDLEEYFFKKSYGTSAFRVLQFHRLMEENSFEYYFQPIINARTGDVFAYEALMRTNPESIGMQPDEILDLAAKENRLYEIEKYTFFNVFHIMKEFSDIFKTKKLFINSISSHQLTEEDFNKLYAEYGPLFEKTVMEITESTHLDEAGLKLIHQRLKCTCSQLALDDYGTGYSNESNLLNSNPNYVKIDRTILRYINVDTKKQHLVSNLVNFAKQNNIKIIAEGIESYEEFEYVINLGVDYIQGFYTAKPNPVLIEALPEETIHKIQKINYKKFSENGISKSYETNGESVLFPALIASDMFSSLVINEKEITLQGSQDMAAGIYVLVPDNHQCRIILDNLSLHSYDKPCISIGNNCSVELILKGNNMISEDGIRVPETSDLTFSGNGNLTIHVEHSSKVGIGGSFNNTYGNITFAATGSIKILRSGNFSVGIGGGQNTINSVLRFISGNVTVETAGYNSLGIGSISGNTRVVIENCSLKINSEGTKSVGIGCILGNLDILSFGDIMIRCEGKSAAGIGAIEESKGTIVIKGGCVNISFNTHTGTGIGSLSGEQNVDIENGDISIYGEGTETVGIGDHNSNSRLHIQNGILYIQLYSTFSLLTGCRMHGVIIDGGNIQCEFPEDQTLVNSYGTLLGSHVIPDTDEFRQVIETVSYSYEYKASYSSRYPYIKVYLPENTVFNNL